MPNGYHHTGLSTQDQFHFAYYVCFLYSSLLLLLQHRIFSVWLLPTRRLNLNNLDRCIRQRYYINWFHQTTARQCHNLFTISSLDITRKLSFLHFICICSLNILCPLHAANYRALLRICSNTFRSCLLMISEHLLYSIFCFLEWMLFENSLWLS